MLLSTKATSSTGTSFLDLAAITLLLLAMGPVLRLDIVDWRLQSWLLRNPAALGELKSILRNLLLLFLRDVIPVSGDVRLVSEQGADLFQGSA